LGMLSCLLLSACSGGSESVRTFVDAGTDAGIDSGVDANVDSNVDSGKINPDYSVLTQHYDNARTGVQNQESKINLLLGLRTAVIHDTGSVIAGTVETQPLLVKDVPLATGASDVVYVGDITNTVYSFTTDANGNITPLKQHQLLAPNERADGYGITSTPAIDKVANRMYVVCRVHDPNPAQSPYNTRNDNSKYVLHVLSLTDLSDLFPPTVITGSVSVPGGTATFAPITQLQRPGLVFNHTAEGSFVSFGFGAAPGSSGLGESVPMQHGWVFTYNVSNAPIQSGIYLSTRVPDNATQLTCPSDLRCFGPGGIWQGAAGLAADALGQVYLATGNATLDANNDGSSIIQLGVSGSRQQIASPSEASFFNQNDLDLGAGGPIVLPYGNDARQFVIGKDGHAYVVGQSAGSLAVLQHFQAVDNPTTTGEVFFGTPTYFNGWVYYVGSSGDSIKALSWDITTGLFTSTTSVVMSAKPEQGGGPALSISANGASDAILWVVRQSGEYGNIRLLAYNADPHMSNQTPLFTWNDSNAGSRFPNLTVANGIVYLISQSSSAKLITIVFK
jgi:hypothetical protein